MKLSGSYHSVRMDELYLMFRRYAQHREPIDISVSRKIHTITSDRCLRVRPLPDFEKNGVWCKSVYRVMVVNNDAILLWWVHLGHHLVNPFCVYGRRSLAAVPSLSMHLLLVLHIIQERHLPELESWRRRVRRYSSQGR